MEWGEERPRECGNGRGVSSGIDIHVPGSMLGARV